MFRLVSTKNAPNKGIDETEFVITEKDVSEPDDENVEENDVDDEHVTEQQQIKNELKNGYQECEGISNNAKVGSTGRKRGPDNQTLLRLLEQVSDILFRFMFSFLLCSFLLFV